MTRTDVCVFAAQEDLETMQAFAQVSSEMSIILLKPFCSQK